jgi:cupin 2 domain-containing protein
VLDNLLRNVPAALEEEQFTLLLSRPGARIERIVSTGQSTPPGEWLEQGWDEWVLLLSGAAGLLVEGDGEFRMEPGDCRLIPAGTRHRVAWTDPAGPTVWLAVHFGGNL